jgi:hypothetical protein
VPIRHDVQVDHIIAFVVHGQGVIETFCLPTCCHSKDVQSLSFRRTINDHVVFSKDLETKHFFDTKHANNGENPREQNTNR